MPDRLRARFNDYGPVAYVERADDQHGFIRFNNQSGAQKSIEKESHFKLELLTGQKEENYWEYLLNQVRRYICNIWAPKHGGFF